MNQCFLKKGGRERGYIRGGKRYERISAFLKSGFMFFI